MACAVMIANAMHLRARQKLAALTKAAKVGNRNSQSAAFLSRARGRRKGRRWQAFRVGCRKCVVSSGQQPGPRTGWEPRPFDLLELVPTRGQNNGFIATLFPAAKANDTPLSQGHRYWFVFRIEPDSLNIQNNLAQILRVAECADR